MRTKKGKRKREERKKKGMGERERINGEKMKREIKPEGRVRKSEV